MNLTVNKFIQRFKKLEKHFKDKDKKIDEIELKDMEEIWNNIKNSEH